MVAIGARQASILTVAVSMLLIGTIGLAGDVAPSPRIGAGLLLAAVVLAFVLGRQSADFW